MYQVSYDYYTSSYGGVLVSEEEFSVISRKAGYLVDGFTFGRLRGINTDETDEDLLIRINDCLCEVCDKIKANTEDGLVNDRLKSSESIANWSVSFEKSSQTDSLNSSIKNTINMYLGGTYLTCAWC